MPRVSPSPPVPAPPERGLGPAIRLSRADAARVLDPIVEHAPFGMALIDAEGRYRRVNPAYARIYGFEPAEMVGRLFTVVLPPADRRSVLALHQAFVRLGGEPGSSERHTNRPESSLSGDRNLVRRDGSAVVVRVESLHWPDADGAPCRLVYVQDITEQQRLTQALQQSRHFLQQVLDGLAAHVCVLNGQGNIIAVNRAWRAFARAEGGADEAVLEGVNYLAVCERAAHPAVPGGEQAARFSSQLLGVLEGRHEGFEHEYACHGPGQQRWFVARVTRVVEDGTVYTVVAHDDVTALKQAQQRLQTQQAFLLDVTASTPGALFRMELRKAAPGRMSWCMVYASPGVQALYGLSPEQVCADPQALRRCVLADDLAAHDASLQQAVAANSPWEMEFRIQAVGSSVKWVHARAQPQGVAGEDPHTVWTGLLSDVTERKRMQAALQASELTYRTLFETVPQGIVYHDPQGRITAANPAAQRILGLSLQQLQGLTPSDPRWHVVHEDGSPFPGEQHPVSVALRTGRPVRDVVMGLCVPDRVPAWILVNATPVLNGDELQAVYASFEDITQRVLLDQELQRQAQTDDLTGAANRRVLMARLTTEFERVRRYPRVTCAVLALDLDHFKRVNDTWGHAAGDAVLRHVVHLLQQQLRTTDLLARSGGEEFVVLLPDTPLAEATRLAERLRREVQSKPTPFGGDLLPVTTSIGLAAIQAADVSPEAVLARADAALYEAKAEGRNSVHGYLP